MPDRRMPLNVNENEKRPAQQGRVPIEHQLRGVVGLPAGGGVGRGGANERMSHFPRFKILNSGF